MERARRMQTPRLHLLGALLVVSGTLAGCIGTTSTGTVVGSVSLVGNVPVHSLYTWVAAWQGNDRRGQVAIDRQSRYRLSLPPGRYVLVIGPTAPEEYYDGVVMVRAGATIHRDLELVFHDNSTTLLGVSGASPCKPSDLAATADHEGGGFAGNTHIGVTLANTSAGACLLSGAPSVSLIRGNGTVLLADTPPHSAPALTTMLLIPHLGNAATLAANWSNWCGPLPGVLHLRITLPKGAGQVDVPFLDTFAPQCIDQGSSSALTLNYAYAWTAAPGTPLHPDTLAVGPTGTLYIVDSQRDQVLSYDGHGTFAVFAGTGQPGFSGDNGPARQAELRLSLFSGLAVGKDGTLYIGDSGNDRVRAVSPNGTISTVLGNGQSGGPPTSSEALHAAIGPVEGLVIGPDGDLYAAAQKGIVHLTNRGKILWAAGSVTPQLLPACGAYCNPANESDFAGCDTLAFDASGDLFCSGGAGTYTVYEVVAHKIAPQPPDAVGQFLNYVGNFRGDGAPAALARGTDGKIVMAYRGGVVHLAADGTTTPITSLSGALGTDFNGQPNIFVGGDGLAIGPDDSIYVDTNMGNAFTAASAIIHLSATGTAPTILWQS